VKQERRHPLIVSALAVQLLLQQQKHQHAGDVSLGQQDGESNANDRTNAAM
jgi:hypothetical protein